MENWGYVKMPKFLAVHPLPNPTSVEEASPLAKKAKSLSTVDAYWVSSWTQLNDKGKIVKILCEWNGKDLKSVKDVVAKSGMPCEGVYPMGKVDSEDFR
jgi:hypothetical protein